MSRSSDAMRDSALAAWRPTMRGLLLILGAMALGLVVFLFVWMNTRGPRVATAPVAPTSQGPGFAPLPAPMPADADGASGMEQPDANADASADQPHVIEAPRPQPAPVAPRPMPPPTVASAAQPSMPVPISSPAPQYPRRALQRNETGTVRIAVDVGTDGVPVDVRVQSSSQSRDLDRAALDAVRKWRFKPGMRNGQPVAETIVVPVEFKL